MGKIYAGMSGLVQNMYYVMLLDQKRDCGVVLHNFHQFESSVHWFE